MGVPMPAMFFVPPHGRLEFDSNAWPHADV
jgi:hypothetical protein